VTATARRVIKTSLLLARIKTYLSNHTLSAEQTTNTIGCVRARSARSQYDLKYPRAFSALLSECRRLSWPKGLAEEFDFITTDMKNLCPAKAKGKLNYQSFLSDMPT